MKTKIFGLHSRTWKRLSSAPANTLIETELEGTVYCAIYEQADGYYAVMITSKNEIMLGICICIISVSMFCMLLLMVIIFLRVNSLTKRLIVNNIGKISQRTFRITGGNLDVEIDVKDNLEFRQLSEGINTTVSSLKEHIEKESERFSEELELAHAIQTSSLAERISAIPEQARP